MRLNKRRQNGWLLAGLAPLLGVLAWWLGRLDLDWRDRSRQSVQRAIVKRDEPQALVPVTTSQPLSQGAAGYHRGSARVYEVKNRPAPDHRAFPWPVAVIPVAILALATFFFLLGRQPVRAQVVPVPGGDAQAGRLALQSWGCGSCHTIPSVPGAYGKVGPALDQMAEQTYIAGMLTNNPENMIRWIMDPQEIQPGNAMPDTGVTEGMARDMAAYLYSIRR